MTEQRERIADAAEAWARAVQNYEDADRQVFWATDETPEKMDNIKRTKEEMEYARQNLLQACGKVGA